jgi:hypothetical protein
MFRVATWRIGLAAVGSAKLLSLSPPSSSPAPRGGGKEVGEIQSQIANLDNNDRARKKENLTGCHPLRPMNGADRALVLSMNSRDLSGMDKPNNRR